MTVYDLWRSPRMTVRRWLRITRSSQLALRGGFSGALPAWTCGLPLCRRSLCLSSLGGTNWSSTAMPVGKHSTASSPGSPEGRCAFVASGSSASRCACRRYEPMRC